MRENKIELVVTINSLLPKGFIGWPSVAYRLLKKYNGKVYNHENKDSDIIKEELTKKYKEISYSDIINSVDPENYNLVLLSLEPSTETSIPCIKGKIYSALCGPRSLNWSRQIKICSTKNVNGIFSELLPDEIDKSIGYRDFTFFNNKSIFLPPVFEFDLNPLPNPKSENTLLIHDKNINNDNHYRFLYLCINVLKKSNINVFELNKYFDFNDLMFMLMKYKHIYSTIPYPQLNLAIAFYANCKISHTNTSQDSVNRYILFNIYNELLITYKSSTTESLRKSLSNIIRNDLIIDSDNTSLERPNYLDDIVLLVVKFIEISNPDKTPKPNGKNDSYYKTLYSQWENKLDNTDYLYKEFQFKKLFESSLLYRLFTNSTSNSIQNCINPSFIKYLSNQDYSYYIQNIFNILFDIDHKKILNIFIKETHLNHNSIFKLIFNKLLLLNDKYILSESWFILKSFFHSVNKNDSFHSQSFVWYLKIMLLTKEDYPNKTEINLIQNNISMLCWIIYDFTEDEMLFPKLRKNGQHFLDFITNICGDNLFNQTRNNLPPIYFPVITSKHDFLINFLNDIEDSGKFPISKFLDLAVTVILFSANFDFLKIYAQKHFKIFVNYKPQNIHDLINFILFCGIHEEGSLFTKGLDSLYLDYEIKDILKSSKTNCLKLLFIGRILGISDFNNRINHLSSFHFFLQPEDEIIFDKSFMVLNDEENAVFSKKFLNFLD
jgi:hypothetical protein